jgi:hypothetical protein
MGQLFINGVYSYILELRRIVWLRHISWPFVSRRSVAISSQGGLEIYCFCLGACFGNMFFISFGTISEGFAWKFF